MFICSQRQLSSICPSFAVMDSKQLQNKKQWKQSGKGTEPIPWSPIIRCARPWRETRAQSAMNKGAREGGVVTVTKTFCDRHLFPMRCLYHRGKSKSIFQPLVGMLWATSNRIAIQTLGAVLLSISSVQLLGWQKIIKCFQIQPIPLIFHLSLSYFDYIALNTLLGGPLVLYMWNDVKNLEKCKPEKWAGSDLFPLIEMSILGN